MDVVTTSVRDRTLKDTDQMRGIYELTLPELEIWLKKHGVVMDAARTIWRWLYDDCVVSYADMVDLPARLQEMLQAELPLHPPNLVTSTQSPDGNTRKDLLRMADGACVETVLLRYRHRYAVCVSTQVGCACDCRFCATGQMGFVRQLSAGEILGQVIHVQRILATEGVRLSNVVLMGMGEPLLNETATLHAVERLVDPRAVRLAPGRVTLSTVGIVPGIHHLADLHSRLPIKLAVSLHAATDDLRNQLMPINRRYPLASLWDALRSYTNKTGRRVFFEWLMISGVNDTPEQALALAEQLQDLPSHVNLIRLNPTESYDAQPSTPDAVDAFTAVLDANGIPHTMRQRRGSRIEAGCGQLRAAHVDSQT